MKSIALLILILFSNTIYSQSIRRTEHQLIKSFEKIIEWSEEKYGNRSYDSLNLFNQNFEKLALNILNKNPETLRFKFNELNKIGLHIETSEDGLFRVYSWDDQTGGTMRRFSNIYQFLGNKSTKALMIKKDEAFESIKIHNLLIDNKKYYILDQLFTGSSALFYCKIKFFSIEKSNLNDKVKLVSTKTGLKNEIGYEVDFSSTLNRNNSHDLKYFYPFYDKNKKVLSIPLILENGKLTNKRIIYKLNGRYFAKRARPEVY